MTQRVALASLSLGFNLAAMAAEDYEDWTARFQTTYVRQVKPAMNTAYSADRGPANFHAVRLHAEF